LAFDVVSLFIDEKLTSICNCATKTGTDVMILKIFSQKKIAKKLAFLTQNKAKLCKILIITLVFDKNANFFAENCRKSRKIVISPSTPGHFPRTGLTF
jgi:hypothetical protein